jgi:transposase-like protein
MKRDPIYTNDAHYPPEIQKMMAETTTCLNCGTTLKHVIGKDGRRIRNRGFCSNICYLEKSPKMAYVEKEYGLPAKEIILQMLNDGTSIIATADRLGVNKQALYAWLDKLDIKKKVVWL